MIRILSILAITFALLGCLGEENPLIGKWKVLCSLPGCATDATLEFSSKRYIHNYVGQETIVQVKKYEVETNRDSKETTVFVIEESGKSSRVVVRSEGPRPFLNFKGQFYDKQNR